jgi:hypothetical protein
MASFAVWSSRGTLFLGLAIAGACAPDRPHYGPPQTADTSTLSEGGAGGGGGSGGAGAAATVNICECTAEAAIGEPDCADCINALAPNGKCTDEVLTCYDEAECKGIVQCPVSCYGKNGDELTACLNACFASLSGPAFVDFKDVMGCVCTKCSNECKTDLVVMCP